MFRSKTLIFLLFALLFSFQALGQKKNQPKGNLSDEEIAVYERQAKQLVQFMEMAFNTLASKKTDYKEKDIIINQSFSKFFRDSKVQIEDDLAENRDVVTNKDVQAYLKDIDFFYDDAKFKFTVEDIKREINDKGRVFFRVRTSRNLQGKTFNGKDVNTTIPRFIEINIDDAQRDLKIVSLYTTKSSEEQELTVWWNKLPTNWRAYFAGDEEAADGINMKDVTFVGTEHLIVETEAGRDSVLINPSRVLGHIRKILGEETLDLTAMTGLTDLTPLYAFAGLRTLDITGLPVKSFDPVRNLSRLENVRAASTQIESVDPIKYTTTIKELNLLGTKINSIEVLENFKNLEQLKISGKGIKDFAPLGELEQLKELVLTNARMDNLDWTANLTNLEILDLSGSVIRNYNALANLSHLRRIDLQNTSIKDLEPIRGLEELQFVFIENTPVKSISPLNGLPELKIVYNDNTAVPQQESIDFMRYRPEVKVIFESKALSGWWTELDDTWKGVFSRYVAISGEPTKEELHDVIKITHIDISGRTDISSLDPLSQLLNLNRLDAARSGLTDLSELENVTGVQSIDISRTGITDLSPLAKLTDLQEVKFNHTGVESFAPLVELPLLQVIDADSVPATDVMELKELATLRRALLDGVPNASAFAAYAFDNYPGSLVVFQTARLENWWSNTSPSWRNVFLEHAGFRVEPDRYMLQQIANLTGISLKQNRNFSDLYPVRMLANLQRLDISGTSIGDISVLGSLRRLKEFNGSNTPVADLTPLSGHDKMERLVIANAPVKKLDVVESFPNIAYIDLSGTEISSLKPLANASKLVQFEGYNTRLRNISQLYALSNLKQVKLYNSRVSKKSIERLQSALPGTEVIYY